MPPPAVPFNPHERIEYLLALGRAPEEAWNEVVEELLEKFLDMADDQVLATDDLTSWAPYIDQDGLERALNWVDEQGLVRPPMFEGMGRSTFDTMRDLVENQPDHTGELGPDDVRLGLSGEMSSEEIDELIARSAVDPDVDLNQAAMRGRRWSEGTFTPDEMLVESLNETEGAAQYNEWLAGVNPEGESPETLAQYSRGAQEARQRAEEQRRKHDPEGRIRRRFPPQDYQLLPREELTRQLQQGNEGTSGPTTTNMAESAGLSRNEQSTLNISVEDFQREMASANIRGGLDANITPADLPQTPDGLTVAVVGGRGHQDPKLVWQALLDMDAATPGGIQRVQFAEQGNISKFVNAWAQMFDRQIQVFPAQWGRFQKAAGPIRAKQWFGNEQTRPDIVLAFEGGKGTAHELEAAGRSGVRAKRIGGWLDPNMQAARGGQVNPNLPRANPETYTAPTVTDTDVPSVHRHISRQEQELRERLGESGMRQGANRMVGSADKAVPGTLMGYSQMELLNNADKIGDDDVFELISSEERKTYPFLSAADRNRLSPDDGSNYQHFRTGPYARRQPSGFDALIDSGLVEEQYDTPEIRDMWDRITRYVSEQGYGVVDQSIDTWDSAEAGGVYKKLLHEATRELGLDRDLVYAAFERAAGDDDYRYRKHALMYDVLVGRASINDGASFGMFVKNAGLENDGWSLGLARRLMTSRNITPSVLARAIVRDVEPPSRSPTLLAVLKENDLFGREAAFHGLPRLVDSEGGKIAISEIEDRVTEARRARISRLSEAELLTAERDVARFLTDILDTENRFEESAGFGTHHAQRDVAAVASGMADENFWHELSRRDAQRLIADQRKGMLGASEAPDNPAGEVTYRVDVMGDDEHFGGKQMDRVSTDIMGAKRVDTTSDITPAANTFSPFDFFADAGIEGDRPGNENIHFRDLSEIHNESTPVLRGNNAEREVSFAPGTQFEHVNQPTGSFLAHHRDSGYPQMFNRVNQMQTVPQDIQQGRQHYANLRNMNQGQLPRNTADALMPQAPADSGIFPVTQGGDVPPTFQYSRGHHQDLQSVGKMRSNELLRKLGAASMPGNVVPMRGGKYIKALLALLAAGIPIALAQQMLSGQQQQSTQADPRSLAMMQ